MSERLITLMRHGQVDGPAALYGHSDIALSSQGYANAMARLAQLHSEAPLSEIISSPLQRCLQPAQQFAAQQRLPLHIEPALKEMHFGHWEATPFSDISDWPALENFWQQPAVHHSPVGESLEAFASRVISAWQQFLATPATGHQLLLCHGGVIRILIAHLLQLDWRNAALFRQLNIDYTSHTRIRLASHPQAQPHILWIGATR